MRLVLALTAALLALPSLAGAVKVPDTNINYPAKTSVKIEGTAHALRITGVGLREKAFFNVYGIASYVASDAQVRGAQGLASADVPKFLHIIMERDVSGAKMAGAFTEAVRANHRSGFNAEIAQLAGLLKKREAKEGEHFRFVNLPGKGVKVSRSSGGSVTIANPKFAVAVWEIYLGRKNVDSDIKKGLLKRL